jgi:signal transduction histidine kinase
MMDESAMILLLLNLVENAIKYGVRSEGAEIGLHLRRSDSKVLLTVSDNGPGIAKDERRRIFDRFYRSKSAQDSGTRGSGIGLSLVKHIAEAHGGRVSVRGDLGKGSIFEVCIPFD